MMTKLHVVTRHHIRLCLISTVFVLFLWLLNLCSCVFVPLSSSFTSSILTSPFCSVLHSVTFFHSTPTSSAALPLLRCNPSPSILCRYSTIAPPLLCDCPALPVPPLRYSVTPPCSSVTPPMLYSVTPPLLSCNSAPTLPVTPPYSTPPYLRVPGGVIAGQ